jgi:5'-AMP-activated protein kinase regulatory beta subunit
MQTSLLQDYVPENLDSVAGFEPPRSPESSYTDPMPGPEEYAKEPPAVPPHLHLTLLNVPQVMETASSLPRPQHVILNHLYVESSCVRYNKSVSFKVCHHCIIQAPDVVNL